MASKKNKYELTYIVNAVLNDEQIKGVVSRTADYIKEHGGRIQESEEWGTRRLAYPIRKKRNGYYVNLMFESDPTLIVRMERMMEIDDDILRYLTLKLDPVMQRFHERQLELGAAARAEAAAAAARAKAAEDEDDDDEDEDED